jgi:hypothetical protein
MSGNSANQSAMAMAARYKRRERLLIVAALALVGCRLLSIRHSVAAMVVATLILVAVFTCYVRDWPAARRWSLRAALPLAVLANALALAIGSLIVVLAMNGLLVQNRLGLHVAWNPAFVCLPIAAGLNLLAWAWPASGRGPRLAAWLANLLLIAYAGWYWNRHESQERFGGEPPFGAELITALAVISLMALAWADDAPWRTADGFAMPTPRGRRRCWRRFVLVLSITLAVWLALIQPFRTVVRRCRLEAELTSLGCEVTDRTRRPAFLRVRELAPLRPYVTEIEAVSIPEGCLAAAGCRPVAEMLGKLTMLDEIEAPRVPAECERLLHRLPAGSFMQYLSLGGEGVTDETLAAVGGFKRLRKAHFIHSRITDDGLRRLGGLRWLDTLTLRGAPLAGRGLAALASLPSLTSLDLAETEVGDQQIAVLQRFAGLSGLERA